MLRLLPAACLCVVAALAACDDTPVLEVCSGLPVPSVRVRVMEAATSAEASVAASGMWVVGERSDSLRHAVPDNGYLYGFGPAGTYTLVVQRPGFVSWSLYGVEVQPGSCGPATVEVEARLQNTT